MILAVVPALAGLPWPMVAIILGVVIVRVVRLTSRKGPRGKPVRPNHPVVDRPRAPGPVPTGIEFVRASAGKPRRTFDPALASYLRIAPPGWLRSAPRDQMRAVYAAQDRLRQDGTIVWAALVQANALLFSPGPTDSPASVVWSDDPYFDDHPGELSQIGSKLFSLKGTRQGDAGLAEFSRMLANERDRANGLQVPDALTGGRIVYHSSVMCVRKHLPGGYLSGSQFPVWADAEPTGLVLLVPAAFWSPDLLRRWQPHR